jgi:hypothetical protein
MSTDTKNAQKTRQNTWYGSTKERVAAWKQVKGALTHGVAQKLKEDVNESRDKWSN